jgi:IS5 family transposase
MVQIAREHRVAEGRRMRVDTTVVETNIHYPTDSSLLGDGVRVLTRTMKKIAGIAGAAGAKLRDRSRSVKLRMLEIARAARSKRSPSQTRLKEAYRKLLNATGRVLGQAKRFATEIGDGVKLALGPEQGRPPTSCARRCWRVCARSSKRWCRVSSG